MRAPACVFVYMLLLFVCLLCLCDFVMRVYTNCCSLSHLVSLSMFHIPCVLFSLLIFFLFCFVFGVCVVAVFFFIHSNHVVFRSNHFCAFTTTNTHENIHIYAHSRFWAGMDVIPVFSIRGYCRE